MKGEGRNSEVAKVLRRHILTFAVTDDTRARIQSALKDEESLSEFLRACVLNELMDREAPRKAVSGDLYAHIMSLAS